MSGESLKKSILNSLFYIYRDRLLEIVDVWECIMMWSVAIHKVKKLYVYFGAQVDY